MSLFECRMTWTRYQVGDNGGVSHEPTTTTLRHTTLEKMWERIANEKLKENRSGHIDDRHTVKFGAIREVTVLNVILVTDELIEAQPRWLQVQQERRDAAIAAAAAKEAERIARSQRTAALREKQEKATLARLMEKYGADKGKVPDVPTPTA